jgi:hypothetical protein
MFPIVNERSLITDLSVPKQAEFDEQYLRRSCRQRFKLPLDCNELLERHG